jgi:hypothetical protein
MPSVASGTFDVQLVPGPAELAGAVGRFELSKTLHGGLQGTGVGIMLSGGNPQTGNAGYVAIETVNGELDGRRGGFALQQFGMMHAGEQTLHYEVVPGSGHGELEGIVGTIHLTIDDGVHRYELQYDITPTS